MRNLIAAIATLLIISCSVNATSDETTLDAIYLWGAKLNIGGDDLVIGDMSSYEGEIPGVTGSGISAANSICEQYFSTSVDANNISVPAAYTLKHRAFLATSSELPQDFELQGVSDLPVKLPDNSGTQIANNWSALFTVDMDIDNAIPYFAWTGLSLSGTEYALGDNCSDWTATTGAVGKVNTYNVVDNDRFHNDDDYICLSTLRLLCITH